MGNTSEGEGGRSRGHTESNSAMGGEDGRFLSGAGTGSGFLGLHMAFS